MLKREMNIADYDAELWQAMEQEKVRQEEHIELIASENYTSPRVMQAQGSQLTNKYAEGYPGKRYYGGCEYVDVVEQLAIDRAKELFGADYANVQPHSGSQANFAVYTALLQPGDTVLGMNLAQGGPLMHVIAAKAVALKEAMEPEFKVYQQQVAKNAKAMVEVFLNRGYKVVSGGTENHLFLLDLVDKNLTGKEADAALGRANITVNKNSVPNDPKSPFVTSGIRIGSPAVTRRGFKEAEVKELAGWMCDVLDNINDEAVIERVKGKVLDICARFPVYA